MIPHKLTHGEKIHSIFAKWNSLIDYLYRSRPVAGPGVKISRTASGTVFSAASTTGATAVLPTIFGSFKVTVTDSSQLSVSEGFVNINGQTLIAASRKIGTADLAPGEHLLCVYADIVDGVGLIEPELLFHEFDAKHYPVAKITKNTDGNIRVQQYPVTVATFIIAKPCIYARVS